MCMPNKCVCIFKRQKCMHFVRMQKVFICECIDVYACVRSPIYRVLHTSKSVAVKKC